MDQTFLENLELSNVYQTQQVDWAIHISFTFNDRGYRLLSVLDNDIFNPACVYHETTEWCAFCQKKAIGKNCKPLEPYLNYLFLRLIEHPSIRLKWLYIPHAIGIS